LLSNKSLKVLEESEPYAKKRTRSEERADR